jgi:endonuclease YncB( thermonuclease family)
LNRIRNPEFAIRNSEIPKPFSGKVIKIVDGDTYDVLAADNKTIRIRMNGIDTPEKTFRAKSKNYLSGLCFGKKYRSNPKLSRNKA